MKKRYLSFILILFSIFFFACKTSEDTNEEPSIYTQEPYISMSIKEKIEYITKNEGTYTRGEYCIETIDVKNGGHTKTAVYFTEEEYGISEETILDDEGYIAIIITLDEKTSYLEFYSMLYESEEREDLISGAHGTINATTYNSTNYLSTIEFEYYSDTPYKSLTNTYIRQLLKNISKLLSNYNLTLYDIGFLSFNSSN